MKVAKQQGLQADLEQWVKLDELPFDFERRRLSVMVRAKISEADGSQAMPLLICKVRFCRPQCCYPLTLRTGSSWSVNHDC